MRSKSFIIFAAIAVLTFLASTVTIPAIARVVGNDYRLPEGTNTELNIDIASTTSSLSPGTKINWSTVAPVPVGRVEAMSAVVDGKLYVFGGFVNSSFNPTNRSDVYNPVNNTWTQIADLPKHLTHVGTAVDGKDIYFAGGYIGKSTPENPNYGGQIFATTDVWKYNVDTNSWLAVPPLPEARGSGQLAVLNRQLHFFGGVDITRADRGEHWILSLDNIGAGWTKAALMPNPRSHMAGVVIGGKIYAIGGQHNTDEKLVTQNSVHVWNPAKPNTWTAVANLPKARSHTSSSTFVMDNRIIVVGGEIAHSKAMADVTAYNPLSNAWTELTPLPIARLSGVAGSIGNQIFFTTGNGFQKTTYKGVPVMSLGSNS